MLNRMFDFSKAKVVGVRVSARNVRILFILNGGSSLWEKVKESACVRC